MTTKVSKDLIASGSITTDHIVDGAVESSKLADSAVGTDKLEDSAVTGDKLAAGAISLSSIRTDRNHGGKLISVDSNGGLSPVSQRAPRQLFYQSFLAGKTNIELTIANVSKEHTRYEILIHDVSFDEADCRMFMRFSGDRGNTWYSQSTDYRYFYSHGGSIQHGKDSAIPFIWSSGGSQIGNNTNEMLCGFFDLYSLKTSLNPTTHFKVSYTRIGSSPIHTFIQGSGQLDRKQNVSGVQLYATKKYSNGRRVRFRTGRVLFHGVR